MKLREYQAKQVFAGRGIRIPRGALARSAVEAEEVAADLAGPVVLKPQLSVKGRGKVGGIRFADDPEEARRAASALLDMTVKGERVRTLLVEERVEIDEELYLAATVDYAARCPVLVASPEGGVDIEEVARTHPDRVLRIPMDVREGIYPGDLRAVSAGMGEDAAEILVTLYDLFRRHDAELVEINPLVRDESGDLVAVDAVLNVDEDSVFRQAELDGYRAEIPVADPIAEEAKENAWTWIALDGDVGVLSSGAGLTMAILDLIHREGGEAANFLDTAQIDDHGIYRAFDLLARAGGQRALLVNMFAGLNRCDRLAEGIRAWLGDHEAPAPVVVRMVGNREEEGRRILEKAGVRPFSDLEEAVACVVRIAAEAEAREEEG